MDITIEIPTKLFKTLSLPETTILLGMVYFKLHGQDRVYYKRSIYDLTITNLNSNIEVTVMLLNKTDLPIPTHETIKRAKIRYFTSLLETIPLRLDRHKIDGTTLPSRTVTGSDLEILNYIRKGYDYVADNELLYIVTNEKVNSIVALTSVLRRSKSRWVSKMCEVIGYKRPLTISDTITD